MPSILKLAFEASIPTILQDVLPMTLTKHCELFTASLGTVQV